MKSKVVIAIFFLATCNALGQTIVNYHTPEYLVQGLFIKPNGGIKVTGVKYKGHLKSIGAFYSNAVNLPVQKGIILTTGMAQLADGPNQSGSTSGEIGAMGDSLLSALSGCKTYDAAVLTIDFIATYHKIEFKYFFASEEYPEYVRKGVNDVFAFLIEGPGFETPVNLALVPGTSIPVTVDNINHLTNTHLFIKNREWFHQSTTSIEGMLPEAEMAYSFQFDGLTKMLTATTTVEPGKVYRITLAIADAGDAAYDSGVFIKAGSFKSFVPTENPVDSALIKLTQMPGITITSNETEIDDTLRMFAPVFFAHDAIEPDKASQHYLKDVGLVLKQNPTLKLHIIGHTDATGNDSYNQRLSERRAASVKEILVLNGANQQAITTEGRGKSSPKAKGQTNTDYAKNRRVEFVFTYPLK